MQKLYQISASSGMISRASQKKLELGAQMVESNKERAKNRTLDTIDEEKPSKDKDGGKKKTKKAVKTLDDSSEEDEPKKEETKSEEPSKKEPKPVQ